MIAIRGHGNGVGRHGSVKVRSSSDIISVATREIAHGNLDFVGTNRIAGKFSRGNCSVNGGN